MRAFIFRWMGMGSDSETEEETSETGAESPESREQAPRMKLRDLRPEKDPMGAGNKTAPPSR